EPIISVGETCVSVLFHIVSLRVDLRSHVSNLDRFAVLVFSLVGDLAGLGLPLPDAGSFKESGDFSVPGVADRLDLIPRIETIGCGDLFENWRARLPPGSCSKDQHG